MNTPYTDSQTSMEPPLNLVVVLWFGNKMTKKFTKTF